MRKHRNQTEVQGLRKLFPTLADPIPAELFFPGELFSVLYCRQGVRKHRNQTEVQGLRKLFPTLACQAIKEAKRGPLSGPLNRLNAILSLLQPLDRYRTPLCDRERDWEGPIFALSRIQTQVGVLNRLVLNRLGGLNRAIVVLQGLKPL